jgi:predicted Holliday junction resolvase-like endonuclease
MDIITIILIIVFLIGIGIAYWLGKKHGMFKRDRYWEKELPGLRKEAIEKSRSVLAGNFSEQLAPYLPDFQYNPNECKFLGKPIDFLVFKGLDEKDISEIVFVEVKSGKSSLSKPERSLKKAVQDKKVKWEEYRIPEDITKKKQKED